MIWVLLIFNLINDSVLLPIAQSHKCTLQELRLLIQCFKEIPLTDYYVLVNDSVTISCIVNNQHGKVQWRAKNLVLGYDRAVPGMPRLQIVGDVTKGEHNLHISVAQQEDSGDYECQVQPVDAHPLLRRKSTLHVTNLPSMPLILYKKEIPNNNEIIIDFNLDVKKMLKLECISENGYPLPVFQWFWNSREIITDDMKFIQVTDSVPNLSTLVIPLSYLNSGHQISCKVKNKATELFYNRTEKPTKIFEVKITIIMFVRPGNPIIQNKLNTVSENDRMELICSLKPTGHPKAKLKWKFLTETDQKMENTIKNHYDDKNDELITKLQLKKLNRSNHRMNVSCISQNQFLTKSSMPFKIFVAHFPDHLSIATFHGEADDLDYKTSLSKVLQQNHLTIINGVENEEINIICFTSSYFGNMNMKWVLQHGDFLDGSKSSIQILSPLIKLNHNLTNNDTVQTFITQKLKLKRTFNSGFLECQAFPENQILIPVKVNFNVLYAPKISIISGYVSQFPVHEGDTIHLTCCAYGGNPIPTIRWYKNNSVALISQENKREKEEQQLLFHYRVFKEDNGQKIFCEAKSENTKIQAVRSKVLIINVIFPPSQLDVICINCTPEKIIANTTNEFICESSSSNPGSIITWRLLNCSSTDINKKMNCISKDLHGSLSTNFPGQYNGWKTQSRLSLKLDYNKNSLILQCHSRLTHRMLPDKYKAIYKNVKLEILHRPYIIEPLFIPDIFEGSTLNLEYKVLANPKASNFTWYFGDKIISKISNLKIENVQFNNSGRYIFLVENPLGNAKKSVEIDIKYSPRIINYKAYFSKGEAILTCESTMNPVHKNFSSIWKRVETLDRLSFSKYTEMKTIPSINYTCSN